MSRVITVRATGPLSLVEDLGRPGLAAIGVGRSGAADRTALRLANRALGNDEDAAGIEVVLGGLSVEVGEVALHACVTGAPVAVDVDGRGVGSHTVLHLAPGSRLTLGRPRHGLRSYLAVRGGIDVAQVLGSRSHDVMAGLGPAPLAVGDVLPVGTSLEQVPGLDSLPWPRLDDPVALRVVRGPRDAWVADVELLVRTTWTATDRSNRVGMRLRGPALAHARDDQLPSEGVWRGAVQVPPGGEPVLFLADHPVTGGYPVVAVVVDEDVDRAAQVRPGQQVRFRWTRL